MTYVAKRSQGRLSLRKQLKAIQYAANQERNAFGATFAECNRLCGVLLKRLGGSVEITAAELAAVGDGRIDVKDGENGPTVSWVQAAATSGYSAEVKESHND